MVNQSVTVTMFVYNNFMRDARVIKEAETLVNEGYDVTVIAVLDNSTLPEELRDGYKIVRIERDPFHYRFLRRYKERSEWVLNNLIRRKQSDGIKSHSEESSNTWFDKLIGFEESFGKIHLNEFAQNRGKVPALLISLLLLPYCMIVAMLVTFHSVISTTLNSLSVFIKRRDTFIGDFLYRILKPCRSVSVKFVRILKRRLKGVKFPASIIVKVVGGWARTGRFKTIKIIWAAYKAVYNKVRKVLLFFHRPFCFMDFYIRSYKLLRTSRSSIYHAHDLNTLPVAWYLAWKKRSKLVYDSHELYTETSNINGFEKKLSIFVETLLIKKADRVITVCDSIADELVGRYKINRPTVLMNCPPREAIQPGHDFIRLLLNVDPSEPIVLYQGGFSPNRGLHNLVRAMHSIPRGHLVMMGWGKIEEDLRSFCKDEGLENRISFIPPVSQRELLQWSSSADVGVIPYQFVGLNNYYSCPNKLFEYINAGIPVVGSFFPEITKIIKNYGIGEVLDPEKPESIADAVNNVLDNYYNTELMTKNLSSAASVLNWDVESLKLKALYMDLV